MTGQGNLQSRAQSLPHCLSIMRYLRLAGSWSPSTCSVNICLAASCTTCPGPGSELSIRTLLLPVGAPQEFPALVQPDGSLKVYLTHVG